MLLWNTKTLSIIIKKSAAKGAVKFTFDGKNAKNAFVSFADKMLDYVTDKDSIFAYENDRVCSDSITYTPKVWINEIKKVSDKDYALVTIPGTILACFPSTAVSWVSALSRRLRRILKRPSYLTLVLGEMRFLTSKKMLPVTSFQLPENLIGSFFPKLATVTGWTLRWL